MISVIMPTYNREKNLMKSIDSVLQQTYTDIELIVVDDGSTDNTRELVKSIQDKRVRYLYQQNQGACVARNLGIANARGEIIAFQDSDDIWDRDKLQDQYNALVKSGSDVVFCKLSISTDGNISIFPHVGEGFISAENLPCGISTQALLMKAEVAKDILFDEEMPRFQDLEWTLRAIQKYNFYCLDKAYLDYEIYDDSISKSPKKMLRAYELLMAKHPEIRNGRRLIWCFLNDTMKKTANSLCMDNDPYYKEMLLTMYKNKTPKFYNAMKLVVSSGLYESCLKAKRKLKNYKK